MSKFMTLKENCFIIFYLLIFIFRLYKQMFSDNMSKIEKPIIVAQENGASYTKISFCPGI